jgi:hypothetical protein
MAASVSTAAVTREASEAGLAPGSAVLTAVMTPGDVTSSRAEASVPAAAVASTGAPATVVVSDAIRAVAR